MIRANHPTSVDRHSLAESPPGLFELWQLIRRQGRWIVVGSIAGIVFAAAYCFFAKPVYQSEAILIVNQKNRQVPQVSTEGQSDIAVEEDLLATHLVILEFGSNVIEEALRKSGMDKAESVLAALDEDQTPVEYVEEHLTVTKGADGAGRLARTLQVSFEHTSASNCQTILNALIDSYCEFINDSQKRSIEQDLRVFEKTRGAAHSELERLQAEYQAFREQTPLSWNGQETKNMHRELAAQLDEDLNKIRRDRIDVKSRLDAILAVSTASDLQRLALVDPEHLKQLELLMSVHQGGTSKERDALVRTEFDELLQLKIARDSLMIRYNVDHPRVKQTTLAIQRIEKMLEEKANGPSFDLQPTIVVRAYVTSLKSKLAQLESQESGVAQLRAHEVKQATALVRCEAEQEQKRGELDRQQQLVADCDARIHAITAALEYDGFTNEFIKSAELGEHVSPRPALLLVVGLILGAGLGTCIGVIRDQSRTPSRQQVREHSAGRLESERSRFEMSV